MVVSNLLPVLYFKNLDFTGDSNKKSIDLPFWYNGSDQTHINQGDNAREHYTLSYPIMSSALSTKLLVNQLYLQIYSTQTVGL